MQATEQLYAGKAKSVYKADDADHVIIAFRDDTSAFDGKKVEQLARKGRVNNQFNAFIMARLAEAGIPTHFERRLSATESLCKRLDMIPVECVVRNLAAGSLCKRLGVAEGQELQPPVFEFFLKDDERGDPMITASHAETFGWATAEQLTRMQELSFRVNEILQKLFLDGDMLLVDYKLEFGVFNGELMLGDEFTPDGCRLWDRASREKMDKDRFRQGLGDVVENYEVVGRRLGLTFDPDA